MITDKNVLIRRLGENDVEGMNMLEKTTEKITSLSKTTEGEKLMLPVILG